MFNCVGLGDFPNKTKEFIYKFTGAGIVLESKILDSFILILE